ncbi:MAG: sugar ABC transporter substrate-binding protein [Planctomycetaceae bacterium]|nr:sugar ABC transporter substrate-binding protein [Planctomycetaceae bacterium]
MKKVLVAVMAAFMFSCAAHAVDVTIITKAMDSEWWKTVKAGAEKFASEQNDMTLNVLAPDREINVQQQIQIIEDQITNEVDGMVLALCGIQEMIPTVEKVANAGIPFVIFDGDIDVQTPLKKAYVGSENYDGGVLAGKFVLEQLPDGGEVGLITGIMGHGPHIGRVAGFMDQVKQNPKIKVAFQQPANSERAVGMTVMENMLTSFPDLKFVFATNDEMALGAAQAAQAEVHPVGIIGFDGTTEARAAIRDGILIGTVDANAFGLGYECAKAGYNAAKGMEQPSLVSVGYKFLTKANVDQ